MNLCSTVFQTSNILEDLETLRLFARVIPEYSRSMEETDILENAFQIIFAFDEIVALGYRESVNLAQIRTFVEMDSHEEKVYQVSLADVGIPSPGSVGSSTKITLLRYKVII